MDTDDSIKLILLIAGVSIGSLLLAGVGGYFLIRSLASKVNSRQNDWVESVASLGFEPDLLKGGIFKTFRAERKGFAIEIDHAQINPRTSGGTVAYDPGITVKIHFPVPLEPDFEVEKRVMLIDRAIAYLGSAGIGHERFDRVFETRASNVEYLAGLLKTENADFERRTLVDELLQSAEDHLIVKITNESVSLTDLAKLGDSQSIDRLIDQAIRLTDKIIAAGNTSVPAFGNQSVGAPGLEGDSI